MDAFVNIILVIITSVLTLIFAIIYFLRQSIGTTIPTLKSSHYKNGNIPDIKSSGGIHSFLTDLHKKFGPVAGFWFGKQLVVSIASPLLFKEHLKLFDRPPILFKTLEPLIGASSIQFANGPDGKQRRRHYDHYFNDVACKNYHAQFTQVGQSLIETWSSLSSTTQIPLHENMMNLALKSILTTAFGFEISENICAKFHNLYNYVFSELQNKVLVNELNHNNPQDDLLIKRIEEIHSLVRNMIEERKTTKKPEMETFLDFLLNDEVSDERCLHDCITYIIGGFHTTGNLLTWTLYYLSSHKEIQENVYQEIIKLLGKEALTEDKIRELKYTRQVIDETIRCSVLAPYAARFQDKDSTIGGHFIPKETPVLQALGVVLNDSDIWHMPEKFDPTRFEKDNIKQRPSLSFSPFGFAGQRICPGQRFAYTEVTIFLSMLLKQFKINLVEEQIVTPVHGLVTRPKEEIWITISSRNNSD